MNTTSEPGPLRALTGAGIAGGMGYLFYRLLSAIVAKLPPVPLDAAPWTRSVSVLVRYLVVGSVSLMTFFFLMAAVGLLAYSGQLAWQRFSNRS